MDSGNSGSLQSSSGGGDDDFDSRGGGGGGVDSSPLSALLRPSPSPFALHGSSLYGLQEFASTAPPRQQPQPQQQQAGAWSGAFTGAAGASSSSSPRVAHADTGARQAETSAPAAAPGAPAPPRGSRKRTRASRRAPTTVLTTDTSNFRAMVQEFTGIPSPPFAAGIGAPASSLRTRFDHLFPSPSSLRSAAGATADSPSLPLYLLRPFAQKLPMAAPSAFPPFTSSSSTTLTSSIGAANANAATAAAATAAASANPSLPAAGTGASDTFQLTSSALLRLQDPSSYLSFQNLLDSQPSSQSMFGAAGGFAQAPQRLHEPSPSPSEFLSGIGSLGGLTHGGLMGGSEGLHLHHARSDAHHHGDELSGVVAGGGSCKLNYSSHAGTATSSSAAAGADKPPDGGGGGGGAHGPGRPSRSEGLDPWICTSE